MKSARTSYMRSEEFMASFLCPGLPQKFLLFFMGSAGRPKYLSWILILGIYTPCISQDTLTVS
jgi:hypothetical protein